MTYEEGVREGLKRAFDALPQKYPYEDSNLDNPADKVAIITWKACIKYCEYKINEEIFNIK